MNVTQPGLNTALLGIQRGQQQVNQAAADIAAAGSSAGSDVSALTTAVVELKQGELQAQASAKALAVQFETLGSLLDETA